MKLQFTIATTNWQVSFVSQALMAGHRLKLVAK